MTHEHFYSDDFDADDILSFDDIFTETDQLDHFRILADIGSNGDALMARLKTDRIPDFAKNTFVFNDEQLSKILPQFPRMVDTLLASQYNISELSVSLQRDYKKDTHGLEVTFGLSEKRNPGDELHTLIAVRRDLRSPADKFADTFTYPADGTRPTAEDVKFPTLSSSDLRKLVASLLPHDGQDMYDLYDDWVQAPENFDFMVQSLALQDCTQINDSTYKLYTDIGEDLGTFTYSTFDDTLISMKLELPEGDTVANYDITLGLLPPPADTRNMDEFDTFYGEKATREVLNNDESPVMVHRLMPRNRRSIPQAASFTELIQINTILRDNNPSIHRQPKEQPYGSTTDITDSNGIPKNDMLHLDENSFNSPNTGA